MTKAEEQEKIIENIDKELCRMEQLNQTDDKYYIVLQMEKYARIAELQFCIENNL